jgi:hypothetical protein
MGISGNGTNPDGRGRNLQREEKLRLAVELASAELRGAQGDDARIQAARHLRSALKRLTHATRYSVSRLTIW